MPDGRRAHSPTMTPDALMREGGRVAAAEIAEVFGGQARPLPERARAARREREADDDAAVVDALRRGRRRAGQERHVAPVRAHRAVAERARDAVSTAIRPGDDFRAVDRIGEQLARAGRQRHECRRDRLLEAEAGWAGVVSEAHGAPGRADGACIRRRGRGTEIVHGHRRCCGFRDETAAAGDERERQHACESPSSLHRSLSTTGGTGLRGKRVPVELGGAKRLSVNAVPRLHTKARRAGAFQNGTAQRAGLKGRSDYKVAGEGVGGSAGTCGMPSSRRSSSPSITSFSSSRRVTDSRLPR